MNAMRQKHSVVKRVVLTAALLVIGLAPVAVIHAQEAEQPPATPAPTPTPEPTPIPATEIPDRAAAVGPLLRAAIASTDIGDEIESVAKDFESEQEHLAELTEETRHRMEVGGPASIIEEAQNSWLRSASRLDEWLSTLKTHSTTIAEKKQRLEEERQLWQLTAPQHHWPR
jgi:hypothetical protein